MKMLICDIITIQGKNGINLPHTTILFLDPGVLEQLNFMPRAIQIIWNKIYMIICGNCLPQMLDGYHRQINMRNNISIIYGTDDLAP